MVFYNLVVFFFLFGGRVRRHSLTEMCREIFVMYSFFLSSIEDKAMALHLDSYSFFLPSVFILDRVPFRDRVSQSWDPLSRACRVVSRGKLDDAGCICPMIVVQRERQSTC